MSRYIRDYINKDIISFAHIDDLLDRKYTIIFESPDGFIIRDDEVGFIYMSFSNFNVMKEELSKTRYMHYIAYEKEIVDFYGDNSKEKKLYQYVYTSKNMFMIDGYDVRVLTPDYAEYVDSFYKAIGPGETSYNALKKGDVLGLFENNELAGIIGKHPEGCVGMLHVLKEYRGKKYGEILEKAIINKLIKENKKIFCEVVDGNEASMHLQNKLNLTQGKKELYWLV